MLIVTKMSASAANTNLTSPSNEVDMSAIKLGNLSMQVVTSGIDGNTATVKVQHSNDNVNWNDVDSGSVTLTGVGSFVLLMTNVMFAYYRTVYDKGNNTTGTVTTTLTYS